VDKQLRAKKIQVSDDLFKSLAIKVAQQQGLMLAADFSFLTHGHGQRRYTTGASMGWTGTQA
jgi:hypothetical protein